MSGNREPDFYFDSEAEFKRLTAASEAPRPHARRPLDVTSRLADASTAIMRFGETVREAADRASETSDRVTRLTAVLKRKGDKR